MRVPAVALGDELLRSVEDLPAAAVAAEEHHPLSPVDLDAHPVEGPVGGTVVVAHLPFESSSCTAPTGRARRSWSGRRSPR